MRTYNLVEYIHLVELRTYNLVEYIHLDEMRIIHCDTSRTGTQHTWQSSRSLLYYI